MITIIIIFNIMLKFIVILFIIMCIVINSKYSQTCAMYRKV